MSLNYDYVVYIDEAGDPGLSRIRPAHPTGSSEWLIISAVVIRRENEQFVPKWHSDLFNSLKRFKGSSIHFLKLNDENKRIACDFIANRKIKAFVVCSNKKNMQGYNNPFASLRSLDKNWFYCWLTRVLLERVSHFIYSHSINTHKEPRKAKIVYSHRGGLSYSQLTAYFELLRLQGRVDGLFLELGRIYMDVIDKNIIEVTPHYAHPGLILPDITASSFFKSCDIYNTGACDPSFAKLLKPSIASTEYTSIDDEQSYRTYAGYGVKLLPSLRGARLREEQKDIFKFYGYPRQWWDPTPTTPSPYRLATISPTVTMDASDKMPDA